jgi:hypothetical protein
MLNGRIKGTHIPRLALAALALAVFFLTLYRELIAQPINFTEPFWAAVVVGFLFMGVLMLVASWIIGLDTRAELFITLFMVLLHLVFDAYIFVQVFALHRALPVALVQLVVQAYWIAGLLDAVLMYWAMNWQRTASTYVSPEHQIAILEREIALLTASYQHLESQHLASTKQAQRMLEDANKVYTATCQGCKREFTGKTQDLANKALYGHSPHCKGVPALVSSNGHGAPIPEIAERGG